MNKELDALREIYTALGQEKSVMYTSMNLTHKKRNDVYAGFVRKGVKPEVPDVLWESQEYLGYMAGVLSSHRMSDAMYSQAVAMVYNSHRTVLPVVGRENLEALHRQRLECLRTALKELKKHPHQAGMKIRDLKETRDLVEDELNEFLAKQNQNTK